MPVGIQRVLLLGIQLHGEWNISAGSDDYSNNSRYMVIIIVIGVVCPMLFTSKGGVLL